MGCASQESPLVATISGLTRNSDNQKNLPALSTQFKYLRVQYNQLPAVYMVLGYVDTKESQTIQTWYSADGEVIKLEEGRIVGTVGLPHDWSQVKLSGLPSWKVLSSGQPASYSRQRDTKMGYAYSVLDNVQVNLRSANAHSPLPPTAPQLPSTAWWVEESTSALPTAYIAVIPEKNDLLWVYSYQCLSPQACLSMQLWPPTFIGP